MGCVQSHQQDRGDRRQNGDRRSPQKQQQQHRQQQHRQQNGQQRQQVQQRLTSENRRLSDHLYENVSPKRQTSPVKNDEACDSQFRRQHFDRNSCLRHSKKRKKSSSVSNPNSPATLTGSDPTEMRRTGQTNSNQNSPTNNNKSVDENEKVDVFNYDAQEVDVDDVFIETNEDRNYHYSNTASSRVAALLSSEPVNLVTFNPTKPVSANSKVPNGTKSVTTTSTTTTTTTSPTKLSKVSSSPVGGQRQNNTGSRIVLRTRRQAAQEEEEQRNRDRGRRKNDTDQAEDCGRLI